jgi:hypothetical protein
MTPIAESPRARLGMRFFLGAASFLDLQWLFFVFLAFLPLLSRAHQDPADGLLPYFWCAAASGASMPSLLNACLYCAIAVDAGLLAMDVSYFAFATSYPDVIYVSDLLYHRLDYKVAMSTFIILQLLGTVTYALARRRQHRLECAGVLLSLLVALVGWCMAAFVHTSDDRFERISAPVHVVGATLFVFGNVASFAFIACDGWARFQRSRTAWHCAMFAAFFVLYVLCGVFGILFTCLGDEKWVFQQLTMLSFLLAHLCFLVNTLEDGADGKEYRQGFNLFSGVRI